MRKKIFPVPKDQKKKFDTWNVLILEDDPHKTRMPAFEEKLSQIWAEMTHVETAHECIEIMKKEKFDWIFLDHDLGGEVFVNTDEENTGSEVARWMSKNWDRFEDSEVVIHSYNSAGAQCMQGHIPKAIYYPGIWNALQGRHKER